MCSRRGSVPRLVPAPDRSARPQRQPAHVHAQPELPERARVCSRRGLLPPSARHRPRRGHQRPDPLLSRHSVRRVSLQTRCAQTADTD